MGLWGLIWVFFSRYRFPAYLCLLIITKSTPNQSSDINPPHKKRKKKKKPYHPTLPSIMPYHKDLKARGGQIEKSAHCSVTDLRSIVATNSGFWSEIDRTSSAPLKPSSPFPHLPRPLIMMSTARKPHPLLAPP